MVLSASSTQSGAARAAAGQSVRYINRLLLSNSTRGLTHPTVQSIKTLAHKIVLLSPAFSRLRDATALVVFGEHLGELVAQFSECGDSPEKRDDGSEN